MPKVRVTFLPDGERVQVDEGTTLREAAIKAGFLNCKGDKCNSCWGLFEIGGEYKRGCDFILREDVRVNLNSREEIWEGENISKATKIAFDIGTTTITAALFDDLGKKVAFKIAINPQVVYGRDVVSRIEAINRNPNLLEKMRSKLLKKMNELIREMHLARIEEIGIAGNPCMEHIFLGISPTRTGEYPYEPEFKNSVQMKAHEVEIDVDGGCEVFLFPLISGWVGGDTVAMILSMGIHKSDEFKMGIDLGTNGEIVFGSRDGILTTSTAAGPAFEGVGIKYGMPAVDGAIERVRIIEKGETKVKVKGGEKEKAKGICGSGIIDAIAEMLKKGIMDKSGRMKHRTFHIQDGVYITQKDVRKAQLAKSAISTGMKILKRESNSKLEKTIVTGSFGNASAESLSAIGIRDAIFKKDAVIEGIKLAMFGKKREAEIIARESKWIDLASHPSFSDEFLKNLEFSK
ncbi:MAG: ASKHA domain-containing protein [Euryarchaeota archaeon]|nr:ASKHA domain-containing protein [Euryarchaeota archaeon]